ncbi:hypothetical protein OG393_30840 [Streptomyces sp. NBC_01216]|uniref:hypothetical protein n=1 Tax=Streptomyces sp. NBC_01216 TaxID=2903778 RepID=UPI002E14D155|nr:hypothetical protein OG393_30840 [Streptomyces sp. NBC_01216]
MTQQTISDLRRELEKARLALTDAQSHLAAHAQANASLHCAAEVFYSPLHAKVTAAITGVEHALARTDQPAKPDHDDTNCPWVWLISDLDRCEHGRHEGDACGGSCGSTSKGNPHMQPGAVIGYTLRRGPLVMPHREDKRTLSAWYQNGSAR